MESISKTPLESQVLTLCEKVLQPQGFRTVDVDCRVSHHSLVRVFIERMAKEGQGAGNPKELAPTLDDCAEASRLLGAAFDEDEALIPGSFDLEVSSPGLDRRLRTRSDFEKAVGENIKLKLTETIPGLGANVTGSLIRLEGEGLVVSVNKKEWNVPISMVRQANIIWRF